VLDTVGARLLTRSPGFLRGLLALLDLPRRREPAMHLFGRRKRLTDYASCAG
jgi:hypothetical protein